MLEDNVLNVIYSDGTQVVLNYGDTEFSNEKYSIPAEDYIVIDKQID